MSFANTAEAEPSIQDIPDPLDVLTELEIYNPNRGYVSHAEAVTTAIAAAGGSEALQLFGGIHDAYAYMLDGEDERSERIRNILGRSLSDPDPIIASTRRNALGFSDSALQWEYAVAEKWRNPFIEDTGRVRAGSFQPETSAESMFHSIAKLQGIDLEIKEDTAVVGKRTIHELDIDERQAIVQGTEELLASASNSRAPFTELGRNFRTGIDNVEAIVDALDEFDIDGLVGKSIEVAENIIDPNKARPSSRWQDFSEMISVYIPALELAGLEELAMHLEDITYQHIYEKTSLFTEAQKMHKAATKYEKELHEIVSRACEKVCAESGIVSFDSIQIKTRVKTIGATINKMVMKGQTPTDMVGLRLIIPDLTDGLWEQFSVHLNSELQKNSGLKFGRLDEEESKAYEAYLDRNTKGSGYKAVHSNYIRPVRRTRGRRKDVATGVEIQVVTESAHAKNREVAPRILYKALWGSSRLAQALRRKNDRTATGDDLELIDQTLGKIQDVKSRVSHYLSQPGNPVLRPATLTRQAESGMFNEFDTVLAHVEQMHRYGFSKEAIVPPYSVTELDFAIISNYLMPGLWNEKFFGYEMLFQEVYDIARSIHKGDTRKDKVNNYFEGHILPVALGYMFYTVSNSRFDQWRESAPWVMIALLHDSMESLLDEKSHLREDEKQALFNRINALPHFIHIHGIEPLTKPDKKPGESSTDREIRYINDLPEGEEIVVKGFDRAHNHLSDFILLERLETAERTEELQRIRGYLAKSQSALFNRMLNAGMIMQVVGLAEEFRRHGIQIDRDLEERIGQAFLKANKQW